MQETANTLVERAAAQGISSLTPNERTYFVVWIAEGEVGNGGMHALCYNSTGNYLREMPDAFLALDAPKKSALFVRLIAAFGREPPSADHMVRLRQHEDLPDSAVAEIDSLDEAFSSAESMDEHLYLLAKKIALPGSMPNAALGDHVTP